MAAAQVAEKHGDERGLICNTFDKCSTCFTIFPLLCLYLTPFTPYTFKYLIQKTNILKESESNMCMGII